MCEPGTTLTVKAEMTYTFFETNTGSAPLLNPGGDLDFVSDKDEDGTPTCDSFGQKTFADGEQAGDNVGDIGGVDGEGAGNGILDPMETWQFTCTVTIASSDDPPGGVLTGTVETVAIGHGIFDNEDTTFCSDEEGETAFEPATTPGGASAPANCDQDEQRTITVTIAGETE